MKEITYEELALSRWSGRKFWSDDVTLSYEWLMSSIRRVRTEYGMKHFNQTLNDILGEGNFSIEPVTNRNKNFLGEYVCVPKSENDDLSEIEIKNRQDVWNIVGFPVLPEIIFSSFREDGRSGWQLSLSDNQDIPISFVEWDDLEGIANMAKALTDLKTCLVTFGLSYPVAAKRLAEKEEYRRNNEEALRIIGLDKAISLPMSDIWAKTLSLFYSSYPLDQSLEWPSLRVADIFLKFDLLDLNDKEKQKIIGGLIHLESSNTPENNAKTEIIWEQIRENILELGYAFIDRTQEGQPEWNPVNPTLVRQATVPISLELYEKMHEFCFKRPEALF